MDANLIEILLSYLVGQFFHKNKNVYTKKNIFGVTNAIPPRIAIIVKLWMPESSNRFYTLYNDFKRYNSDIKHSNFNRKD